MSVLTHVVVNIAPENREFYKNLFGALGWTTNYEDDAEYGVAGKNGESLYFVNSGSAVQDRDGIGINHLALGASSQAEVDAAAGYLQKSNIDALFDTPRHRPEFSSDPAQTYYQVMFESPDKVLFEVVYVGLKE